MLLNSLRVLLGVNVQLQQCDANLDRAIAVEARRMNDADQHNALLVQRARQVQSHCSAAFGDARLALEAWASNGVPLPFVSTCRGAEKDKIKDEVGDISAARSEALAVSEGYSHESQGSVGRLADYVALRMAYDAAYADNKTQHIQDNFQQWSEAISLPSLNLNVTIDHLLPEVDVLVSCLTMRGSGNVSCPLGDSAHDLVKQTVGDLQFRLSKTLDVVSEYEDKVREYQDNVWEAFENSRTFYESVRKIVYMFNFDTSGWDWYNVEVASFYPTEVRFPRMVDMGEIPGIDDVWESVAPALDEFHESLADARRDAHALGQKWKGDMKEQLSNLPSLTPADYNPPQYVGATNSNVRTAADEKKWHERKSEEFLFESSASIDAFAKLAFNQSDNSFTSAPPSSFNFTTYKDKTSTFQFNFESLKGSAMNFSSW